MLTQNVILKPRQKRLGIIYGRLKHTDSTTAKLESSRIQLDDADLNQVADNRLIGQSNTLTPKLSNISLHQRDLKRIEKAIAYIETKFTEHISPEGLAIEVKISTSKLQAGLKYVTGFTLSGYQEQVRIRAAKDLLESTNKQIKVISKIVGFKTHSHFSEIFRNITNLTPFEYRNRYGC